jgi:TP901 family phage tail tape measure protein
VIEVAHIVARVTTDLTRFNTGMQAAEARAKTTSEKMSVAGMRMTKYLSLPMAAIGYSAVKSSIHFSDSMTQIQTQAGATHAGMLNLTQAVKDMAAGTTTESKKMAEAFHMPKKALDDLFKGGTTQGPQELSEALYHIASVGYRGGAALRILKASAEGAQIGLAPLEDTASALAAVIRTNIKGTGDYRDVMATLNATVGAGNVRFDRLIQAIGTGILPTAKLAGLTFKDVAASLTIFTDEGMNANSAMTRLRTGLMMMQSPSKKAAESMGLMGISADKLGVIIRSGPGGWGKALKFIEVQYKATIKKLMAHGSTRHEAQTQAFRLMSQSFGGSKTASTIMTLVNQADLYQKKYRQIDRGRKKFDEDLAASGATMGAKLRKSWSKIRVALIDLGDAMTPTVVAFAKGIAKLADGFSQLPGPVKKFAGGLAFMLILLGPMLIVGSSVVKMYKTMKEALITLRIAQLYFNDAVKGNPWMVWITLAAILIMILWHSKTFRKVVTEVLKAVFGAFKWAIGGIVSFVKAHWPLLIAILLGPLAVAALEVYKHWGTIKRVFFGALHWIVGFVKQYWPYIVGAMLGPVGLVAAGVYRHWGAIKGFVVRISKAIFGFVKQYWPYIAGAMLGPLGLMVVYVIRHWNAIWNFIKGMAGKLGRAARNAMLAIVNWIKKAAVWAYNAAKHLGTMIKNGVIDGMKGLGKHILSALDPLQHVPGGKRLEHAVGGLFRASGGPVHMGRPYIVGERGPEWFVPRQSGTIIPNGAGGGNTRSVTIENMNVRGDEDIYAIASVLGRKLSF